MKYFLFILTSLFLLSSCGRGSEVAPIPEDTVPKEQTLPAPVDLTVPLVDGSGAISCPAGLVFVEGATPPRCEYDNRPL